VVAGEADSRTGRVAALVAELAELGCAEPAVDCEVSDPATGEVLAIAEACWPEGLRPGQGDPVVLVPDPAETDLTRLRELGYQVFTSTDSLRDQLRRKNQRRHRRGHLGVADRAEPPRDEDDDVPMTATRM
jgi:hypothetical protein